MPKHGMKASKTKVRAAHGTLAGVNHLPLGQFARPEMPDHMSIRFVYSDFRPLVATGGIAEYIYRANSLFDPDASGLGGQPQGFDQWKTLYSYYRVVAVGVEVCAASNTSASGGLLAVAAVDTSSATSSPEELAGTRRAVSCQYTDAQPGRVKALWRISDLFGMTDEAVLGDINCRAAVTANPTNQYYINVAVETSTSTLQTMVWVKLTYYARMEWPTVTLDVAARHRRLFSIAQSGTDGGSIAATLAARGTPDEGADPDDRETRGQTTDRRVRTEPGVQAQRLPDSRVARQVEQRAVRQLSSSELAAATQRALRQALSQAGDQ